MSAVKEFGKKNYENSKKEYEKYRNELMSNIVVGEYLTLLNDINDDLQLLKDIISYEVNKEFEDWFIRVSFFMSISGKRVNNAISYWLSVTLNV